MCIRDRFSRTDYPKDQRHIEPGIELFEIKRDRYTKKHKRGEAKVRITNKRGKDRGIAWNNDVIYKGHRNTQKIHRDQLSENLFRSIEMKINLAALTYIEQEIIKELASNFIEKKLEERRRKIAYIGQLKKERKTVGISQLNRAYIEDTKEGLLLRAEWWDYFSAHNTIATLEIKPISEA